MPDYYKILEIDSFASKEDIRKSYRKKSLEYHPDKTAVLGEELKQLASRKMILINEAYRVLGDEKLREDYDQNLNNNKKDIFYIVCRECGHSMSLSPGDHVVEKCPICSAAIGFNPKETMLIKTFGLSDQFDFDWHLALVLLKCSYDCRNELELPSSMQIKWSNLFFNVDVFSDGRFCLFTHFKPMYQSLEEFLGDKLPTWDDDQEIGFVPLSVDAKESALLLQRLSSFFEPSDCSVSFNAGERKGAISEPNLIFISAIKDVSLVSAKSRWENANFNLLNIAWAKNISFEELSSRIKSLYRLSYGEVRKSTFDRVKDDNKELVGTCLNQVEMKIQDLSLSLQKLKDFL